MRIRALSVILGGILLLGACGSSDGKVTSEGSKSEEPQTTSAATPEDALKDPPLRPVGAVPIASDSSHIWMSDFSRIATYSTDAQQWTASDLPWPVERVAGLWLASPEEGGVRGLVILCEAACELEADDVGPVRAVGFTVLSDDRQSVEVIGEPSDLIESFGTFQLISIEGDQAGWQLTLGDGGLVVSVTADSITSTAYKGRLNALCPIEDGKYVGFETVDVSQSGAVAWAPLPEGWDPDPEDAQRFVAGQLDGLQPAEMPSEANNVLANWVGQAKVCLPNGIALVGSKTAWEFEGGRWTEHPSAMADNILNEFAGVFRPVADYQLAEAASGAVRRSADGSWSSLNLDPVHIGLNGLDLTYTRPSTQEASGGN